MCSRVVIPGNVSLLDGEVACPSLEFASDEGVPVCTPRKANLREVDVARSTLESAVIVVVVYVCPAVKVNPLDDAVAHPLLCLQTAEHITTQCSCPPDYWHITVEDVMRFKCETTMSIKQILQHSPRERVTAL